MYKYISEGRNGIIVESFIDKKRTFVHINTKASSLEDIAIFTDKEEVPLADVFKLIFEKEEGKEAISHKSSNEELKEYFSSVLPEYDKSRVYTSDIKKVIYWYNTLANLKLLKFDEKEEKEKGEKEKDEKEVSENKVKEKVQAQDTKKVAAVKAAQRIQGSKVQTAGTRKGGSAGKKV